MTVLYELMPCRVPEVSECLKDVALTESGRPQVDLESKQTTLALSLINVESPGLDRTRSSLLLMTLRMTSLSDLDYLILSMITCTHTTQRLPTFSLVAFDATSSQQQALVLWVNAVARLLP